MTAGSRDQLKRAAIARLDSVAVEHERVGHQGAYANRYQMRSDHGVQIELMFEKAPDTPPHLWLLAADAVPLAESGIPSRFYPKSDLYKVAGKNGKLRYGRHSGLERMPRLGKADLTRLTLRTLADLEEILSVLRQLRRAEVVEA